MPRAGLGALTVVLVWSTRFLAQVKEVEVGIPPQVPSLSYLL